MRKGFPARTLPRMTPVSVTEAAAQLGVSVRRVRQLCEAGRLKADRIGRAWLIDRKALERFKPLPPGRPANDPD